MVSQTSLPLVENGDFEIGQSGGVYPKHYLNYQAPAHGFDADALPIHSIE
jgi:hypothetical protein